MIQITFSPKFSRSFKKLSNDIKNLAKSKINIFQSDCFDPRLKTHKLSGRFEGFWSFSINYKYRIIFDFDEENVVRFHVIGNHDIYE